MIKTILIDDEEDGLEALQLTLEQYCPELRIEGAFNTPESGIQGIRTLQPQLVFLDVQMPGMSGFDLLQELSPVSFEVIFVSAHERYAIKAIRFSALDYLLKPVIAEELVHAVGRVKERLIRKDPGFHLQSVLNNIRYRSGKIDRLAVPSLEGIDFFETRDIIYCEAERNYTTIFLTGRQRKIVSRNLKEFETMLTDSGFCRVHHSFLINLKHVRRYIRGEGGYAVLTDDHHVVISRRKKEEFLAMLDRV